MNTLIGFRRDRLGGRLSNLLYTWRLAKKLGCRAVIFWPKPTKGMEEFYGDGYDVGNFIDLLQTYAANDDNDLWIIDHDPGDLSHYPSFLTDPFLQERNVDGVDADAVFTNSATVVYNGYTLMRMKGEDRKEAMLDIPALLARLTPNGEVTAAYERLLTQCKPHAMAAVHYRRGDIVQFLRQALEKPEKAESKKKAISKHTAFWFRKCAPLESYISFINKHLKAEQKIAIFTDESGAADHFISEFGPDRVYSAQAFDKTLLSIQYVFLEMIFMSNCRSIVSTKSGFSEVPAIMGGKKIVNIQKYCSLEQIADDYLEITRLDRHHTLPEIVSEIFGNQGAYHYRKMFRSAWTETDFRDALAARWSLKAAAHRSANVA